MADTLSFWMRELGWSDPVRFAPYNQVFQQLLDPASLFASNRGGMNVALVRLEDGLEDHTGELVSAVRSAAPGMASPLLVCLCPESGGFAAVRAGLEGIANTYVVTPDELSALYPVADYHDPHGEELGHVPYTPEFFAALGTMVMRRAHAIRMKPWKVIALDCDETLWRGVCGEDGPSGIQIDPPHRALQEFMVARHDAGMLLCLCSKNNEEDVLETFRAHPEMPLKLEHFIARRINWEPKSANLASLAEELELGLDSFIQVEDNPAECAEIEASCPEVLNVALPAAPGEIPRFLRHVWAFDHLRTTEEDRNRTALYAQRLERGRLQREATSLQEFLDSLNLQVRIAEIAPDEIPRVSQLTQRTNQMNFTTIRRSEAEIAALLRSDRWRRLAVHVSDRFGSYGLVGVMLAELRDDTLRLDTFLLSCRALGKGVEHRMLARVGEIAPKMVEIPFAPTARNRPALDLLQSIGAPSRVPAEWLAAVRYKPGAASARVHPAPAPATPRAAIDYVRIARDLPEPAAILCAARRESSAAVSPSVAPRTALEGQLAAIWADLLNVPAVGAHDDFFDLGGHSLLAVQLLSRVRQVLGVDLSLSVLYNGEFTVAGLAKAIELDSMEHGDPAEYADLLREIERLSDEEARALLAEEDAR